jgi:hypothetical protein
MPEQLTSVKVNDSLFETFKIECIKYKFSLRKLTERAIDLYNNNPEFRKMIHNHQLPKFDSSTTEE